MLRIKESLGNEIIWFHYCDKAEDLQEVQEFLESHPSLGIDTESTDINCYKDGWQLRSVQVADAFDSYVIPAAHDMFIYAMLRFSDINWIGHNGPHDIRSIDAWVGRDTGVLCAGETYIPAHHHDSRNRQEGGVGHGLKEQAIAHISRDAGKWEAALKQEFKRIEIPLPGQVYKSGPRKGQPKVRKAKLSEGWGLIDPTNRAYIAYAAADPLLTYRLWRYYQPTVREFHSLYRFDKAVQDAADKLQRRAMRLDVTYTERLSEAFLTKAEVFKERAAELDCANINSGAQIANALAALEVYLTARTPKGQIKTDNKTLRALLLRDVPPEAKALVRAVLGAKQLLKRRESYTEQMLSEVDSAGRVHPSINTLGARTTRMSVSNPPLQQLPTANHEEDAQ